MSEHKFEGGKVGEAVVGVYKSIENAVVTGYKEIENGAVEGYKKIETGAVEGYKKVEHAFVDRFLEKDKTEDIVNENSEKQTSNIE